MKLWKVLPAVIPAAYLFAIAPRLMKKPDVDHLTKYWYAHRGLHDNESEDAPENTLPAFQKAVDHGYGMELDVQLTRDDRVVVAHDMDLKRICGVDKKIRDLTYEELKQYPILKSKETIPLFTDVLKIVDGKVPMIVELKCTGFSDDTPPKVNEILKNYDGPYCVESFQPAAMGWYKKNRPDVVRGQLAGNMKGKPEDKLPMKALYRVLTHLGMNFISRPDFVAYDARYCGEISRKVCSLLGALPVAWTIKSQEQLDQVRKQYKVFIFEGFLPDEDKPLR